MALIRGEIDRKTAVRAAQQAHRNYAKRQMTWFRREPDVIWISGFGDDARIQSEAIRKIADMQGSNEFFAPTWGHPSAALELMLLDCLLDTTIAKH